MYIYVRALTVYAHVYKIFVENAILRLNAFRKATVT